MNCDLDSLDSPATYVESIHKLFKQSDVIGECLFGFQHLYARLT